MGLLKLTYESPDADINTVLGVTKNAAQQEFKSLQWQGENPTSGFGIGLLRPYHVGISTYVWQFSVTASFANWINRTLGDDYYLIPTGIFNLTLDPSTTELQPTANGIDLPVMQIEELYTFEEPRAFFSKPFAVSPNNILKIQAVGKIAQTEKMGLLGYIIAKRSYLITQAPSS